MSLNKVILNGRVPNFDPTYYPQDGDKSAFLQMSISVKRNFKKQDEKYYPEDLIRIKAFGATATFIYDYFKAGAGIDIEGSLQKDDPYTDDNGVEKAGGLYVMVEKAYFPEGNAKEGSSTGTSNNAGSNRSTGRAQSQAGRGTASAGRPTPGPSGARVPGGRSNVPGGARRTQGGPPSVNR